MVDDHNDAGRVEKLRVGRSMSILRGEKRRGARRECKQEECQDNWTEVRENNKGECEEV